MCYAKFPFFKDFIDTMWLFFFFSVRVRSVSSVGKMISVIHIPGRGRGKRGNSCRAKRTQNVASYLCVKASRSALIFLISSSSISHKQLM